jgi:hypothetical protein
MHTKYIKVTLTKPFESKSDDIYNSHYFEALQSFIYDHGCITGWEKKLLSDDKNQLSYKCTTQFKESDLTYLRDTWSKDISDNCAHVNIDDKLDVSGDMYINFGEEQ